MSRPNRRDFLKRAAVGSLAAFTIAGTKASGRVLGANDRVRIAVAGINTRGMNHLDAYFRLKDQVEIAYLVDPDSRLFAERTKLVQQKAGTTPTCLADLRKVLDDKNLDAVSIAAPNHWHSLLAIWACQAGKDAYVEKPCGHTVFEGRKLVEAARRYDRIVQHGTQARSDPNWINQVAAVRSGKYGKLLIAYGYAGKPRKSIGIKPTKEPPKELDFDIWLGPAAQQPYHENLVHYNWHWFWDFGNGEIGNQGVHQMDIARWAMPEGAVPKSLVSLGGRFAWDDQGQTPNTLLTVIDFGEAKIVFEDRDMVDSKTANTSNEFRMEGGLIKQGKFFPNGKSQGEPLSDVAGIPLTEDDRDSTTRHIRNFIDCVRSRKRENLQAEILEGHRSAMLCHLANISYRSGTDVSFLHPIEAFGNDTAAYEAWGSMKQHLVDVCDKKLDGATCRLGRKLAIDAKAEKVIGDEEANKLLTQPYRKPYVVPENV